MEKKIDEFKEKNGIYTLKQTTITKPSDGFVPVEDIKHSSSVDDAGKYHKKLRNSCIFSSGYTKMPELFSFVEIARIFSQDFYINSLATASKICYNKNSNVIQDVKSIPCKESELLLCPFQPGY